MNFHISLAFLLAASVISFQDEDGGDSKTARKHYGLSFHSKCMDYVKSFTCMTTCKSIGFQIFRMDFRCKCSCHGLKTTTILPFFKWRTNGTTKTLPRTQSPNLYHIAGTLSPAPTETTEETGTTAEPVTCVPPEPTTLTASDNTTLTASDNTTLTASDNTTTDDVSGNTTTVDNEQTDDETTIADESTTEPEDGETTTNSESTVTGQTTDAGNTIQTDNTNTEITTTPSTEPAPGE